MKKIIKVLLPVYMAMNISAAEAQVPTCPIKAPFLPEYNRNSPFGDKICPALNNLNEVVDGLSSNASKKIDEVKKELNTFRKEVMDGVINNDAAEKLTSAMDFAEKAKNDLLNLVKDKECGAPAAWNAMKQKFEQVGKDLVSLTTIASKATRAFSKLQPAFPEMVRIMKTLADIGTSINNQSPEIKKQFDILKSAIDAIVKDFKELEKLDIAKVVKSGTGVATGLVPYVASCVTCATSTATAIAGVVEAGGGTLGGTGTVETGVGGVVGAIVAVLGTGQTLAATLASQASCKYMIDNTAKLNEYLDDLSTFINAVAEITSSLADNTENMIKASKALVEITKALGKENEPNVKSIKQSLVTIAAAISNTADAFEKEVTPLMVKFTDAKVRQIAEDARQINECYTKIIASVGWITRDVIQGVKDLSTAAAGIVDADKLVKNLKTQFDNAVNAASKETKDFWNRLDQSRDNLVRSLLGSKPTDLGAVATHVLTLGNEINRIKSTASSLAGQVSSMVGDMVNKLAKGSNTQISKLKKQISDTRNKIYDITRETLKTIAKAKAKFEAKAKAHAQQNANVVVNVKTVLTLKPLTTAVTLGVMVKQ